MVNKNIKPGVMHNHLGKQLVIQDSMSDLTPLIKLLSESPCVHAIRNYVVQQYPICTKYNRVHWLFKINIHIYILCQDSD